MGKRKWRTKKKRQKDEIGKLGGIWDPGDLATARRTVRALVPAFLLSTLV
jgi:hypothetical protein